ncbi:MAG: hypothetical protein HXY50_05970 [Ignavibacteriaceae bacterium]|nr:hypothetical protein [Ignavibacteriaceae bacterium]
MTIPKKIIRVTRTVFENEEVLLDGFLLELEESFPFTNFLDNTLLKSF